MNVDKVHLQFFGAEVSRLYALRKTDTAYPKVIAALPADRRDSVVARAESVAVYNTKHRNSTHAEIGEIS